MLQYKTIAPATLKLLQRIQALPESLSEIFNWYQQKYPEANPALALRSMSYFVDAEAQPLPSMLQPFSWEDAKGLICKSVREIVTGR